MDRSKVVSQSLEGAHADERGKRPASGVYAIPLAVAASYDVAVARDEFVGIDRLDRDELDETDADARNAAPAVCVIVPAYRRSA